ncbi:hypothetical protein AB0E10_01815 [Streptomyces sp. NPDC048045]|uniref:hypothetical protein n=1 Tax=Streptomyces sp. NPDC048045 TaxID=3154710 RepID=UPI003445C17C
MEQLTTTLQTVEDPGTSPQERDSAIRTAQALSSALDVIGGSGTPPALRGQLTGVVKHVTATLNAANHSGTPPEQRHAATLVAERSASLLGMIGDSRTPAGLRASLIRMANNSNSAVTHDSMPGSHHGHAGTKVAEAMSVSFLFLSDPNTPDHERKELADATDEVGSSLQNQDDQDASNEKSDRMEKKQQEAFSAQDLPDAPLPEAAEVCTNAVFDSVPDDTLSSNLKSVVPKRWDTEGVNDFWKSNERGNDSLDVFVQLQNDKPDDSELKIEHLIPKLADSLPASRLFTLGPPGLRCLRAALQLDRDFGVTSDSWAKMAVRMAKGKE